MTAGRRPGENATHAEILTAARKLFAENGYDRTTVRSIGAEAGAEAGVNAAMVHYFFGSKEQVFVAALELPANPAQVVPVLLDGPREQFGQRLAGFLMSLWTSPRGTTWVRFHHSESATAAAMSRPPPTANHDARAMCLRTIVNAAGRWASALLSWSAFWARKNMPLVVREICMSAP